MAQELPIRPPKNYTPYKKPRKRISLPQYYFDQFIIPAAKPDLNSKLKPGFPISVGEIHAEQRYVVDVIMRWIRRQMDN